MGVYSREHPFMIATRHDRVKGAEVQAAQAVPRESSDTELMERYFARGDRAAFAVLVERYGGRVWKVCRRVLARDEDAEDAFQAVFLVLARSGREIRNQGAVGGWLYGVAYRTAMKARRAQAR